jgi:hypothetical protein
MVEESFSGKYLDKSFKPECHPPPDALEYNPVISYKWLKVNLMQFLSIKTKR